MAKSKQTIQASDDGTSEEKLLWVCTKLYESFGRIVGNTKKLLYDILVILVDLISCNPLGNRKVNKESKSSELMTLSTSVLTLTATQGGILAYLAQIRGLAKWSVLAGHAAITSAVLLYLLWSMRTTDSDNDSQGHMPGTLLYTRGSLAYSKFVLVVSFVASFFLGYGYYKGLYDPVGELVPYPESKVYMKNSVEIEGYVARGVFIDVSLDDEYRHNLTMLISAIRGQLEVDTDRGVVTYMAWTDPFLGSFEDFKCRVFNEARDGQRSIAFVYSKVTTSTWKDEFTLRQLRYTEEGANTPGNLGNVVAVTAVRPGDRVVIFYLDKRTEPNKGKLELVKL